MLADYNPVLRNRMDVAFLDKAAYWVNLVYVASVGLTMATSVVVVYISYQRAALRDFELKKVQSQSEERVAAANQLAAEANQRVASSNAEAAKAESKAADASLAEAQIRKENLQLSIQLEREKQARLEIEQRIQQQAAAVPDSQSAPPRVLTADHETALLAEMRHFSKTQVTIIELSDPEAGGLARQIISVLEKAGWRVVVSRIGALTPPQYGLICVHRPADTAAAALVNALRSSNLIVYDRNEPVDQFEVIVGLKPR